MPRYDLREPIEGRGNLPFRDFEALSIHHPSTNAAAVRANNPRAVDSEAAIVNGELEAVRTRDGNTLVKKDIVFLDQDGRANVGIPAPVAGYIHYLGDATQAVRIYDKPADDPSRRLVGQVLHMDRNSFDLPEGSFVQYGQPLGRQSDTGSPGAVHAHIELQVDQFTRYINDLKSGAITQETYPGIGNPGQIRQNSAPALASALADGVLREGDSGPEVITLQQQLNQRGFRDAQGRVLATDGDFGERTEQAVQAFQRARGLEADGVVGRDTFAALRQPIQQQPPTQQPALPQTPQLPAVMQNGPTTLSNLIGSGEGGYNSYNRGRAGDSGGREIDFSQMTLAEIMRRQDLPRNDPERLFAVGKFQMIPATMEETVNAMGLDRNQRFTPELQERMFADYLVDEKRPSVHAYITSESHGPEGLRRAQIALAQEFASVADPRTGRSYYDGDSAGNSASITAQQVESALSQMRTQYQANIDRGLSPDAAYRGLGGVPAREPSGAMRSNADNFIKHGEKSENIRQLQDTLNNFGYRDKDGRALKEDGGFGDRTKEAVQAFQQAHGLKADGVVGPQTFDALKKAEQTPLISDPRHPDNVMFQQAVKGLEQLGPQTFKSRQELESLAGAMVFEAKVSGLKQIDHVALSTNGTGLFAVQGAMDDPAHHRVHVDKTQAASQPLERSTVQLQQEVQNQSQQQQEREQRRALAI